MKRIKLTGHTVLTGFFCTVFYVAMGLMNPSVLPADESDSQSISKSSSAANIEYTSLSTEEPISTATGEYYFHDNLMVLGGPIPLAFGYFYGSQLDTKQFHDGLPRRFAGSHKGTVSRLDVSMPRELFVNPGKGKEIGFYKSSDKWILSGTESVIYQLTETDDFYYFLDPIQNRLYTFQKESVSYAYKTIERVSVSSTGAQASSYSSEPDISRDERYVVFHSYDSDLVADDTNSKTDIFVRDLLTDETVCISRAPDGSQSDGQSYNPAISGDGRFVVYESLATNLVSPGTSGRRNIYLYEMATGQTTLISVNADGSESNGSSEGAAISDDGQYIAFASYGSDFVANDTNENKDVFLYDRTTGKTKLISAASDGTQGDANSFGPDISGDGSVVAFTSDAATLVANDTNEKRDVFIRDLNTDTTRRISVSSDGQQGDDGSNRTSTKPTVSGDGRYVAFTSSATNLISNDTNEKRDVFVRDLSQGETWRVSVSSSGDQGDGDSMYPSFSTDGNVVAFRTKSAFSDDDTNNANDIYIHNLSSQKTVLVSIPVPGGLGNDDSSLPACSSDGQVVVFMSSATNMVTGDTNGDSDIFVAAVQSEGGAFLTKVEDRNGNFLSYETTDPDTLETRGPDRIYDGLGRELKFTYAQVGAADTKPYLTKVEDQTGRAYTFEYEDCPADNDGEVTLRSITDPMGNQTTFAYGHDNLITEKQFPKGNVHCRQTYETIAQGGIVQTQTDAYNHVTTVTKNEFTPYTGDESQFTVTYPDGSERVFVHDHQARVIKSVQDPAGNIIAFSSDTQKDRITGVTDRLGDATSIAYHAETGKIASYTNALGNKTSDTFVAQDQTFTNPVNEEPVTLTFYNRSQTEHPDGTARQYEYDDKGNLVTCTDPAGNIWQYTYGDQGELATRTNPLGGTITYSYNNDLTLASMNDPETGTTLYEYDAGKRLVKIIYPDGGVKEFAYNLNDQITSTTGENGNTWSYEYDANGNLINCTDPLGNMASTEYDLMDRPEQVINERGGILLFEYDSMGRLDNFVDPDGVKQELGYNNHGWLTGFTIGNETWATMYDEEGVPTAFTDPMGNEKYMTSDKLGAVVAKTDASGNTTTFERDVLNRVTRITDPLGRATQFAYTVSGDLASVEKPVTGTMAHAYNGLGQLTQLTDPKNAQWAFTYSNLGRVTSHTDPNGNQKRVAYNSRGLVQKITFADDSTVTNTYDAAKNLTAREYSGGLSQNFAYDELNRLTEADGIGFSHDESGHIIRTQNQDNTIFGATFTDAGKLDSVTYNDGLFTVTYSYDATTGLLNEVSDTLTGTTVTFSHDTARRLTAINRPGDMDTSIEYDKDYRLSLIKHGNYQIRYTLDGAGQVTAVESTLPLAAADSIHTGIVNYSVDAANQITTSGFLYDARGRMTASPDYACTWDGASRLTGINDAGLAYNGLGNPVARTKEGETIQYYYNYAVALYPMMAEKDQNTDQFTRYYVWTPAGKLLYMIDATDNNKVYFYHFDRQGSTLALTDSSGNLTDSYAYSPYGALLAHDGTMEQPFTFIGMHGIRQEGDSGVLYQIRARYYDANLGRFLSRDPIWPDIFDPRSVSPYQYAWNTPAGMMDVTGLRPEGVTSTEDDYLAALVLNHDWGDKYLSSDQLEYLGELQQEIDYYQMLLGFIGNEDNKAMIEENSSMLGNQSRETIIEKLNSFLSQLEFERKSMLGYLILDLIRFGVYDVERLRSELESADIEKRLQEQMRWEEEKKELMEEVVKALEENVNYLQENVNYLQGNVNIWQEAVNKSQIR